MPIKHTDTKDVVILSYSAYSVYKQCPHKYYLEKILRMKVPEEDRSFTIPGLVVHEASERFLKEGDHSGFDANSINAKLEEFNKEEQVDLISAYGSIEKAQNFSQICAENLNKFLMARNIPSKKFLTEAWFGTWEDPLFLSPNLATQGAPDLIEINENGSAILYDFKSTWSTKYLNKDQLKLYCIASEIKFGVKITMASFFLLPANKHEYFRFSDADKNQLVDEMQVAANQILTLGEDLPCTPSERCDRCQYFSTCTAGKEFTPPTKLETPKIEFGGTSFGADL